MKSRLAMRMQLSSALSILLLSGCGGGEGFTRVPVSGTVSVEGGSSASGSLTLTADIADKADQSIRPTVSAPFSNGKFSFEAAFGPAPGAYLAEVAVNLPDEPAGDVPPEYANETGAKSVVYRKSVMIPVGGGESLAIEVTASDKVGGSGGQGSGGYIER